MQAERAGAAELFNQALEAFKRGGIAEAVTLLRAGFFENLYIAPELLGEEYEVLAIWYPGPDARPETAREYKARYGEVWRATAGALALLEEVWSDHLVRRELERYINLSKAILQTRGETQRREFLREREWFLDRRRIRRTQAELLARLEREVCERPLEPPRLALVLLASKDPKRTVEFYRSLFQVEPAKTSRLAGGYAEFELPGVRVGIHGYHSLREGDPYRLGPPPDSLGWGAVFVIRVTSFDRYYENAGRAGIEIVDCDLETPGRRFFLVKDPSGYLIEITEEDPRGI